MDPFASPPKASEVILKDAIQCDLTTARRATLLNILWGERYLTRQHLRYSRDPRRPGYYLKDQPPISEALSALIHSTLVEIDPAQMEILPRLTPAQRVELGDSLTDAAREVVTYRIRLRNPNLSEQEANYMAERGMEQP